MVAAQSATSPRRERLNDAGDVKALLQARIDELVRQLCPGGTQAGRYYMARNPARDDRRPGSFWVMTKAHPGAWRDEATGDKGDIFGLIQLTQGLDFKGALDWAKAWLNFETLPRGTVEAAKARKRIDAGDQQARELRLLEDNRARALALWLKASEDLTDTMTARYLATRGIELSALERVPGCIRHFSHHKHLEDGNGWPCMATLMTSSVTGRPQAVHRTYLARDGLGKAPVVPARKIWPSFSGAVMRLARGETGLACGDAVKRGLVDRLILCEGVEDGLSIALACPELRVWAAGSLGNLQHVKLPDCCHEVIVAADNDWGKPQAEKLLTKALAALAAQRRPVRVARSMIGKDANDALRG